MCAAEDIFFADSEAVLAILRELSGDEGLNARWEIALLGTDMLLSDCGFDLRGKHAVMTELRGSFFEEFKVGLPMRKQLGERFRAERQNIHSCSMSRLIGIHRSAWRAGHFRRARLGLSALSIDFGALRGQVGF